MSKRKSTSECEWLRMSKLNEKIQELLFTEHRIQDGQWTYLNDERVKHTLLVLWFILMTRFSNTKK